VRREMPSKQATGYALSPGRSAYCPEGARTTAYEDAVWGQGMMPTTWYVDGTVGTRHSRYYAVPRVAARTKLLHFRPLTLFAGVLPGGD
jgi:hypothetical protein